MPDILNTLTRAELESIKLKAVKEKRHCAFCDKAILMRPDQHFCSANCRAKYAAAASRVAYERLLKEREDWLLERAAFVKEVARLRELLGPLINN